MLKKEMKVAIVFASFKYTHWGCVSRNCRTQTSILGGYLISLKIPVVGENAPNIVKLALTTNHAILPLPKDPLIYFAQWIVGMFLKFIF